MQFINIKHLRLTFAVFLNIILVNNIFAADWIRVDDTLPHTRTKEINLDSLFNDKFAVYNKNLYTIINSDVYQFNGNLNAPLWTQISNISIDTLIHQMFILY